MIEQVGRGFSTIVTEHGALTQPDVRSVTVSENVPAPTLMQRVVWPLLQAYEKFPVGPQIWTVSPGHTLVSGASIEQAMLPHNTVAEAVSVTTMAWPSLTQGDWNAPSTLALFVCSPWQSAERLARITIVQLAPAARLNGP